MSKKVLTTDGCVFYLEHDNKNRILYSKTKTTNHFIHYRDGNFYLTTEDNKDKWINTEKIPENEARFILLMMCINGREIRK